MKLALIVIMVQLNEMIKPLKCSSYRSLIYVPVSYKKLSHISKLQIQMMYTKWNYVDSSYTRYGIICYFESLQTMSMVRLLSLLSKSNPLYPLNDRVIGSKPATARTICVRKCNLVSYGEYRPSTGSSQRRWLDKLQN